MYVNAFMYLGIHVFISNGLYRHMCIDIEWVTIMYIEIYAYMYISYTLEFK